MSAGTYEIINTITNNRYLGSSIDVIARLRHHRSELRGGYHKNSRLQRAFNKYGESSFIFRQLVQTTDVQNARIHEQMLLTYSKLTNQPVYNLKFDAIGGNGDYWDRPEAETERCRRRDRWTGPNNPRYGEQRADFLTSIRKSSYAPDALRKRRKTIAARLDLPAFQHISGARIPAGMRYIELKQHFGLDRKGIVALLAGRWSHYKGWTPLPTENTESELVTTSDSVPPDADEQQ